MELVSVRQPFSSSYTNNMTQEFDQHLTDEWKEIDIFNTYITKPRETHGRLHCAIRFPGATRGTIWLDNDMSIAEINVYQDTGIGKHGCYKRSILDVKDKYVGAQLVFAGKEKEE